MHDSFDLLARPWILVQGLDGRVEEISILQLFERASELRTILGDVPTQTFAITRLLLAILHRSVGGPVDPNAWEGLWRIDGLPMADIRAYVDKWRSRFDLLHSETPFYQVADLRTAKDGIFGLERLIADVPAGAPFFTTRLKQGIESITFAEAARWLVHCQAFDPSGIKSGAVGDPRVKGGRGYPIGTGWAGAIGGVLAEGRNLRESLLLNLVVPDSGHLRTTDEDRPVWERAPQGAGSNDPKPQGWLDLYTWQSRRIRLFAENGEVYGVVIANGDKLDLHDRQDQEPMSAWRRSTPQEKRLGRPLIYMPATHKSERRVWQGLASFLPSLAGWRTGDGGRPSLAPAVLEWIGDLRYDNILPPNYPVRVHAIGMVYGDKSATIAEIIDDELWLAADLLQEQNEELGTQIQGAIDDAESGAEAVENLAANLAVAAGDWQDGAGSRAREAAYLALDRPFRSWLAGLRSGTPSLQARTDWQVAARNALLDLERDLVAESGPKAWVGRSVKERKGESRHVSSSEAAIWFRSRMRKVFTLAYQKNESVA